MNKELHFLISLQGVENWFGFRFTRNGNTAIFKYTYVFSAVLLDFSSFLVNFSVPSLERLQRTLIINLKMLSTDLCTTFYPISDCTSIAGFFCFLAYALPMPKVGGGGGSSPD